MINILIRIIFLICTCSLLTAQDISPPDTSVIDTNALLIEWKHKTLTDKIVKFAITPYCYSVLVLSLNESPSRKIKFVPELIFYGGITYGILSGIKTVEKNERNKLAEIREGRNLDKTNDSINMSFFPYSMGWRSIVGLFSGGIAAGSFEYLGYGLLKNSDNKTHDGNYWIVWPIAGFYKGLESANKKYGLPSGSVFTSLLVAGLVYSAFEYSFYGTIGKNEIHPIAQGITFSMLYVGYNFKNRELIFSRR